jgi:hypothetical protein
MSTFDVNKVVTMRESDSDLEIDASRGFLRYVVESPYSHDGETESGDVVQSDVHVIISGHLQPIGISSVKTPRPEVNA